MNIHPSIFYHLILLRLLEPIPAERERQCAPWTGPGPVYCRVTISTFLPWICFFNVSLHTVFILTCFCFYSLLWIHYFVCFLFFTLPHSPPLTYPLISCTWLWAVKLTCSIWSPCNQILWSCFLPCRLLSQACFPTPPQPHTPFCRTSNLPGLPVPPDLTLTDDFSTTSSTVSGLFSPYFPICSFNKYTLLPSSLSVYLWTLNDWRTYRQYVTVIPS